MSYIIFINIFCIVINYCYIRNELLKVLIMSLLNGTESIEVVEQVICDYFGTTIEDVYSRNKKSAVALARHFIIYILNTHYSYSYRKLSARYKRHFNAIVYAVKQIHFNINHDKKYKKYYQSIWCE